MWMLFCILHNGEGPHHCSVCVRNHFHKSTLTISVHVHRTVENVCSIAMCVMNAAV
jgi:hypothetical protein